ncbi:hypothetical protein AB0K51_19050 [Kitasatospora sp. NPDC049285]|uniref:hypothetical protein n=1 Tax=Kitasatospora sp. NPDC049285 TaxID=3157096 RepID=UPI0034228CD5
MGLFDKQPDQETSRGLLDPVLPHQATAGQVVVQPLPGTAIDQIPAPYKPLGTGELTPKEAADLEACEAGIQNLQNAFWIAGKSLDTIKEAELHREKHTSFAAYVVDRWDISESQAHRLVDAWRLGERIAKLGLKPRESQVREIVAVSKDKGMETAVALYDAAVETYGKVTAQILKDLVTALPEGPMPSPRVAQFVREEKTRQDSEPKIEVITTASPASSPIGESQRPADDVGATTAGLPEAEVASGGATGTGPSGHSGEVPTADGAASDRRFPAAEESAPADNSIEKTLGAVLNLLQAAETELVGVQEQDPVSRSDKANQLIAEIEGRASLIAQAAKQLNS